MKELYTKQVRSEARKLRIPSAPTAAGSCEKTLRTEFLLRVFWVFWVLWADAALTSDLMRGAV